MWWDWFLQGRIVVLFVRGNKTVVSNRNFVWWDWFLQRRMVVLFVKGNKTVVSNLSFAWWNWFLQFNRESLKGMYLAFLSKSAGPWHGKPINPNKVKVFPNTYLPLTSESWPLKTNKVVIILLSQTGVTKLVVWILPCATKALDTKSQLYQHCSQGCVVLVLQKRCVVLVLQNFPVRAQKSVSSLNTLFFALNRTWRSHTKLNRKSGQCIYLFKWNTHVQVSTVCTGLFVLSCFTDEIHRNYN